MYCGVCACGVSCFGFVVVCGLVDSVLIWCLMVLVFLPHVAFCLVICVDCGILRRCFSINTMFCMWFDILFDVLRVFVVFVCFAILFCVLMFCGFVDFCCFG